jgi:hypothetical protein
MSMVADVDERSKKEAQAAGAGACGRIAAHQTKSGLGDGLRCGRVNEGRMVRILTLDDAYTRERLALEADFSMGSGRVTRVLKRAMAERGQPEPVDSDNGPEFTS